MATWRHTTQEQIQDICSSQFLNNHSYIKIMKNCKVESILLGCYHREKHLHLIFSSKKALHYYKPSSGNTNCLNNRSVSNLHHSCKALCHFYQPSRNRQEKPVGSESGKWSKANINKNTKFYFTVLYSTLICIRPHSQTGKNACAEWQVD